MLTPEQTPIDELQPYKNNARLHSDEQVEQIAKSIKEFGFLNPVLVDDQYTILAGHGRVMGAKKLGLDTVPTIQIKHLSESQKKAYIIADNQIALNAGWDKNILKIELESLADFDYPLEITGLSLDQIEELDKEKVDAKNNNKLADKFLIPPFTVFNAREGWWQDRKQFWLSLGIKSELGRGDNIIGYSKTASIKKSKFGKALEAGIGGKYGRKEIDGTSVFDPVLCELIYKWFCPPNGVVLDPFAGGSVRGIVASKLRRKYVGSELRQEQVEANQTQAQDLCKDYIPVWHSGDSKKIHETCSDVKADMVFSCPPYADLEVYSDNPLDLSNMRYENFISSYREIIKKACGLLKDNSFACFVVGEVRDKKGNYYNFVGDTAQAFMEAGLNYYNEAILITMIGSLPVRVGKAFESSRKLGKTHQNVLVFVKGDSVKATKRCGKVEVNLASEHY
tara:strand:- start:877 stop:2229 length:1353 start_codon:yes stop_codon:yes gene_type:complete